MRLLFTSWVICIVFTSVIAQEGRVYFSHVMPEIFQDIYVTPDEKTLVVKSAEDVVAMEVATGKRLMWWKLPATRSSGRNGIDFTYRGAKLVPLPDNFTNTLGLGVWLLRRPPGSTQRYGTLDNVHRYDPENKTWPSGSKGFGKLLGYATDGRPLLTAQMRAEEFPAGYEKMGSEVNVYRSDEKGEAEYVAVGVSSPFLFGHNRYLSYLGGPDVNKLEKSAQRQRYVHDLETGRRWPAFTDKSVMKAVGRTDLRFSQCHPEYWYFRGKYYSRNKQSESFYYDYVNQRIVDLPVDEEDCPGSAAHAFVSKSFVWKTVRHQVTDSTGTYEATLVEAYDRNTNKLAHRVQLTHDLLERKAWEDGSQDRLTAAIERREQRRENAIAAAAGKAKYTGWAAILNTAPLRRDGGAGIAYDLSETRTFYGNLAHYFSPGDELYFPGNAGYRKITEVDVLNGVLQLGQAGNTEAEQNQVHYIPITERICHLTHTQRQVTTTVTCPKCNGSKKIFRGTEPDGTYGQWYYNGKTNRDGSAQMQRTVNQKRIYGKCERCDGQGRVPGVEGVSTPTYVCLKAAE